MKTTLIYFFAGLFLLFSVLYIVSQKNYYDMRDECYNRVRIECARIDLMHNIYINNPEEWKRLEQTEEFAVLDSLLEGYWEDFYLY